MVSITCCVCQLSFAVVEGFQRARKNDHIIFYCPVGHGQNYPDPRSKENKEQESKVIEDLQSKVKELEKMITKRPRLAWWRK